MTFSVNIMPNVPEMKFSFIIRRLYPVPYHVFVA